MKNNKKLKNIMKNNKKLFILLLFVVVFFLFVLRKKIKMKKELKNVKDLSISKNGLDFIKSHEALRLSAYLDPVGIPTIGWGHTDNVHLGLTISEEEATMFLKQDVKIAENKVKYHINVMMNQAQYDALVSHVFNTGGSTNLYSLINGKKVHFKGKEYDLGSWWTETYITAKKNNKNIKLAGLVRRRKEEFEMFNA